VDDGQDKEGDLVGAIPPGEWCLAANVLVSDA
jgi:hypothetical protein